MRRREYLKTACSVNRDTEGRAWQNLTPERLDEKKDGHGVLTGSWPKRKEHPEDARSQQQRSVWNRKSCEEAAVFAGFNSSYDVGKDGQSHWSRGRGCRREPKEELDSENAEEIPNAEDLKMGLVMEREAGFCGR